MILERERVQHATCESILLLSFCGVWGIYSGQKCVVCVCWQLWLNRTPSDGLLTVLVCLCLMTSVQLLLKYSHKWQQLVSKQAGPQLENLKEQTMWIQLLWIKFFPSQLHRFKVFLSYSAPQFRKIGELVQNVVKFKIALTPSKM